MRSKTGIHWRCCHEGERRPWLVTMPTVVTSTRVPGTSGLHRFMEADDFVDCYATATGLSAREVAGIVIRYPAWVRVLMLLRRVVTTPFGLINQVDGPVEKIGMFPIESETDEEIIAGFDDRHLDFRIAILVKEGTAYFATWVRPHNAGGKLYLAAVMPFYVLICRNALTRVASGS